MTRSLKAKLGGDEFVVLLDRHTIDRDGALADADNRMLTAKRNTQQLSEPRDKPTVPSALR